MVRSVKMKHEPKDQHLVIYVDKTTKEKLNQLASLGYTKSALLRRWILKGLEDLATKRN